MNTISAYIPTVEDVDLKPTYVVVRIDLGGHSVYGAKEDTSVSKTVAYWFESNYTDFRRLV